MFVCIGVVLLAVGGSWKEALTNVVTALIDFWIYWLIHNVKVLKANVNASSESIARAYVSSGAPCLMFSSVCS